MGESSMRYCPYCSSESMDALDATGRIVTCGACGAYAIPSGAVTPDDAHVIRHHLQELYEQTGQGISQFVHRTPRCGKCNAIMYQRAFEGNNADLRWDCCPACGAASLETPTAIRAADSLEQIRPHGETPKYEEPEVQEGPESIPTKVFNFVGVLAGLALGFLLLSWWLHSNYIGLVSNSWLETKGQIQTSSIDDVQSRKYGDRYFLNFGYTYTVGKRTYYGDNVYADGDRLQFHSREAAEEFQAKYPAGKKVLVYYDPQDSSSSALLRGRSNIAGVEFGIMALTIGIPVIVFITVAPYKIFKRLFSIKWRH